MALRKRPLAAGLATLLFSGYLSALGLGEIRLNSALNEPLDAEIPLLNMGELSEEEIIAGLASNADFAKAGVGKELILTTLVFDLDMEATGGPILRIASKKPIREPYLDFLVDVQWPTGRLLREYTLLLDLPVFAGGSASKKKIEQPVARQRPGAPSQQGVSQPAPASGASSRTAPRAVAGDQEYLVERGDTLWSIASSLPSDASIHERMEAILQINPDAFINGDINLLKRGAVLRLPDYGAMDTRLSGRGSSTAGEPAYSPELSASRRQERPSAPVNNGGRLSLDAGSDGQVGASSVGTGAGNTSGLRGEVTVLEEELDRSRRENSELKQRLASLEDQITTMQRLVEIGDDDLRAIQLSSQMGADDENESAPESAGDDTGTGVLVDDGNRIGALDMDAGNFEEDSPALALFPSASTPRNRPPLVTRDQEGRGVLDTGDSAGVDQPVPDSALVTAPPVAAETADEVAVAETDPAPKTTGFTSNNEGWFDKVNGFLLALLGLVVIVVAAAAVFIMRKRQEADEEYQPPAEAPRAVVPPPAPAPVRETPRAAPPAPQARSMDDIELREEDDLFAQPKEAPAVAPTPTPAPAPAPREESLEDMELDLSEFDLDEAEEPRQDLVFDEPGAPPAPAAEELNLDEEFDFLGDIDEGDTQLELAQAYIEMGDQSGAREILQEVAENGSDEQKEKARQLLGQVG